MASRLNPYISFDGTAREAMEFYKSIFGGTLDLNTFGDFGSPDQDFSNQIMHGQLETDAGFTLMGADSPPGQEYRAGDNITISLSGDDDALREYWAKLADGGTVTIPLEKQMWGDEFGSCIDKFGIPWLVNIAAPPSA